MGRVSVAGLKAGDKFNKLTFVEKSSEAKPKDLWRCECGVEKLMYSGAIVTGRSKSCGCWKASKKTDTLKAGDKFNSWTFVRHIPEDRTRDLWRCDCGTEKPNQSLCIMGGNGKSCGCLKRNGILKKETLVENGDVFGKLTVISEAETTPINRNGKRTNVRWANCQCECGRKKKIRIINLTQGQTKSCGCGRARIQAMFDKTSPLAERGINYCDQGLRRRHSSMIQRCFNPKDPNWDGYGGRGITVCDEWLGVNGYKNYFKFITGLPNFAQSMEVDRIDNDKGYNPDNVRMVSRKQQSINKRRSRIYSVNGKEYSTIVEAAKAEGLKRTSMAYRMGLERKKGILVPPKKGYSWRWKYPESHAK